MDELIQKLKQLSAEAIQKIEAGELSFEYLEQFAGVREKLVRRLQMQAWSEDEKAMYKEDVHKLLQTDAIILDKMHEYKLQAGEELRKIRSGRMQKSAYEKAYSTDGVFFDKKR